MARYVRLRKNATLPTKATRGQIRVYAKSDETLETVDDEGNRAPVGDGEPGGAGAILTATVDLDAADIATLSSVPVQVVAAPGAGKVIVPVGASFHYKAGAVAFDTPQIVSLTASSGLFIAMDSPSIAFDTTGGEVATFHNVGGKGTDTETGAVLLRCWDGDPDGAGDGTGRITVAYYVMDLLA